MYYSCLTFIPKRVMKTFSDWPVPQDQKHKNTETQRGEGQIWLPVKFTTFIRDPNQTCPRGLLGLKGAFCYKIESNLRMGIKSPSKTADYKKLSILMLDMRTFEEKSKKVQLNRKLRAKIFCCFQIMFYKSKKKHFIGLTGKFWEFLKQNFQLNQFSLLKCFR